VESVISGFTYYDYQVLLMAFSQTIWKKCRKDYETKGVSVSNLAKKYKMGTTIVTKRIKNEGWKKYIIPLSAEIAAKAERKSAEMRLSVLNTQESVAMVQEMHDIEAIRAKNDYVEELNRSERIASKTEILQKHRNSLQHVEDSDLESIDKVSGTNKSLAETRQSGVNIDNSTTNNTQVNIFADIAAQHESIYDSVVYDES